MHHRSQQRLTLEQYLQQKSVQERIQSDIERVRFEAAVSIGNAARLFGFTENQLRDWEGRKLIEPYRRGQDEGIRGQRHRQYSMRELEKLAVIRELLTNEFTPGDILSNISGFQRAVSSLQLVVPPAEIEVEEVESDHHEIDTYVVAVYDELFWRYYISQVLRLVFMLTCEDEPYSLGGILLPTTPQEDVPDSIPADEVDRVGEALVGWLGRSGSFYAFTTPTPGFDVASDYRVVSLKSLLSSDQDRAELKQDQTFLLLERRLLERRLEEFMITRDAAVTIKRLLTPIYEAIEEWRPFFAPGRRDQTFPSNEFGTRLRPPDLLLNGLTELVANGGGEIEDGARRWDFCCLLLPHDPLLPPRLQNLIVQAQSAASPYRIGVINTAPHDTLLSLSTRAFLSGRVVYRDELIRGNALVIYNELEEPMHSAVALPIGGENGEPLGVLYVASRHADAFNEDDQRFLRMLGRVIEDLLLSYQVRHRVSNHLKLIVNKPSIVDNLLEGFFTEQDFVQDVCALLERIKREASPDQSAGENREVSFIAIDIDGCSRIARVYSTALVQNLIKKIGLAIEALMRTVFMQNEGYRLYYIYADRFYLVLDNVPLKDARQNAFLLRSNLAGSHKAAISRAGATDGGPTMDGVIVPDVKVRVGVTAYNYSTLADIVEAGEYSNISDIQAQINASLKESLKKGIDEGGNLVISWYPEQKIFKKWEPDSFYGLNK